MPAAQPSVPAVSSAERISSRLGLVPILLAVLVVLYLGLASTYSHVTPVAADQHNPDENAHMLYVGSIAAGHLPVFHAGAADYEAHQPPLYYLLCAPVALAVHRQGSEAETKAVRGVSIVLGALLIVAVFLASATLFPRQPLIALGAAAFVGLLPMNVSLSGSVTNDTLADLVVVLALWRLIVLIRDAGQAGANIMRRSLEVGILIGLGIWSKTSTLLLLPMVAAAFYFLARRQVIASPLALRGACASLGIGVLVGLPWLLRNQLLYGDPLAQHLFENAFRNTALAPDIIRWVFGGSIGAYLWGVARWTFASFWGVFDSMRLFWGQGPQGRTPSPAGGLPVLYQVLGLLCVAVGIGLWRVLRRPDEERTPAQTVCLQVLGVLILLTWLAHLRFVLVFFQAQGRYWYPALLPLALGFVWGLSGLTPKPRLLLAALCVMAGGLLALNLYTLVFLLPQRFPSV